LTCEPAAPTSGKISQEAPGVDKGPRREVHEGSREIPEKGDRLKLSQFRRLRVGDYRVVYEIHRRPNRVIVLYVDHRKNVYDDFSILV
jgi:mRNA-degrading endonuclease RelE of RelBE toxin-antitoxin system